MHNERTERRREFIINIAYYAIVITLAFLCLKYVVKWIMPFVVGFIIALIMKPSINAVCRVTKLNRKLCTVVMLIIDYAILILIMWGLGSKLFTSLKDLFTQLPSYYNDTISPLFDTIYKAVIDFSARISPDTMSWVYSMYESLSDNVREFIVRFSSGMVSWLANTTTKLPFFLISFVFTILSSVFISMDYSGIFEFVKRQLPPKAAVFLSDARRHLGKSAAGYLRAYGIILVMTFTELSIGFLILRIKGAITLAAIIAVADILPVIGTGGILIPWAIVMLINRDLFVGIGLLVMYLIITLIRNFTEPKIVGDQLGLHPLVTLISIYVGYRLLGVTGMILLPVTVTILVGLHKTGRIKLWKE